VGIKTTSDSAPKWSHYEVQGGQVVDDNGNPAVTVPEVAAQVTVSSNQSGTFTYTVNGGESQTGTYGTALTGINVGDAVVVTPGTVAGYAATQSHASFTATDSAADNADVVTYTVNQTSIVVHYQDYFGNTLAPDSSLNGDYTATVDGTASAPTATGYTFNAADAKNSPAKTITFSKPDADGNVVVTDAAGAAVTEITLYYKTNINLTVTGTKVYNGMDYDYGNDDFPDDPVNIGYLIFTDGAGNIFKLDTSGINSSNIYYTSPDVGVYPGSILVNTGMINSKNPEYQVSSVTDGDFTITAAPVNATIESDDTATKAYDGQPISYVPTVDFSRTDTDDTSAIVPNTGTNPKDKITWDAADFEYLQDGVVVTNPKDVGTYSIQFSAAGKAKLAAATNFAITPVYDGTYTITAADTTVTLSGGETETYNGAQQKPDASHYSVTLPTGVTYTLTDADVELASGGINEGTYGVVLSETGKTNIEAAVTKATGTNYTVKYGDATGTFTITPADTKVTLSGSENETYNGAQQKPDASHYSVTLPTGVKYTLTNDDIQLVSGGKDHGTYDVVLSDKGKTDIQAAITAKTGTNYTVTFGTPTESTFTIDKAKAIITVEDGGSQYDGSSHSLPNSNVTITGVIGDEQLGYSLTNNARTDAGSQTVSIVLTDSAVNDNYNIDATDTAQLTITPADTTVTLSGSESEIYNGSQQKPDASHYSVTLPTGVKYTLTNDDIQLASGGTDVDTYQVQLSTAGEKNIQAAITAATGTNYKVIFGEPTGSFEITPAAGSVTLNGGSKTYDGVTVPDLTIDAPVKVALEQGDYTVTPVTGTADLKGAGTYTYQLTQAGIDKITKVNSNYTLNDLTKLTSTYTINKMKVTLTANNSGKIFGADDPELTASTDVPIVAGDTLDYTIARVSGEDAGTYDITVTAGTNANYDITVGKTGTFTITPATVTNIRIENGTKVYDSKAINAWPDVYATLSNGKEIQLIWSSKTLNVDFVFTPTTGTADLTGVGSYTSQLSAIGVTNLLSVNTNYYLPGLAAATGTYIITPATASINVNDGSKFYDGKIISDAPTVSLIDSADGIAVPKDVTLGTGDYTIENNAKDAGEYTIVLTEQGVNTIAKAFSNFSLGDISGKTATYTIKKQPVTITVTGGTYEYDEANPITHSPTVAVSGAVEGETLAYTISTKGLTYPGSKTVTVTFDAANAVNKNYDINVVSDALTITGDAFKAFNRTIHFEGAGDQTPQDVDQTLTYSVTEDADGILHYSLMDALPEVVIPLITGYTPSSADVTLAKDSDGNYLPIKMDNAGTNFDGVDPTNGDITITYSADEEPVTVNATGNKVGTGFTYTVNGGDAQTGSYGTALTGIHYGDTVAITPNAQDGYMIHSDTNTIVVSEIADNNVANVTYEADAQYVDVQVIEKNTGKIIGSVRLNGHTDDNYTIATPPASFNIHYMEGMANDGTLVNEINDAVLLTYAGLKYGDSLSGTYKAGDGIPTIVIYYEMQPYTLKTDFLVANDDGTYKTVGTGTVTYTPAIPATGTSAEVPEQITYTGIPAGYDATPVDSAIKYVDDKTYIPLGSVDGAIITSDDLALRVSDDGTISTALDETFNPSFVLTPLAQDVNVTAVGNSAENNTFTYTVNGGEKLTGTYGTSLPDIVTGDVIAVTPNVQDGRAFTQSSASITASGADPETTDTDTVTYSTIALSAPDIIYGDTPSYSFDIQTDSGVKTVELTADDVTVADGNLNAGTHTVSLNADGLKKLQDANPDYTFGLITGTITVNQKQITVTANGDTKVYGTDDPTFTANYDKSQLVGNDTLNYTVSREAGEDVGGYFVTVTVGNNANYAIKPVAGRFTITPASTTGNEDASVKTDDKTITYGDTTPTLSVIVGKNLTTKDAGLTNADFTITDAKYTNDGKDLAAGKYQVTLNADGIKNLEAVNKNFTIDDVTAGTLTVNPKQITVTANDNKKVYGTDDPTFTASYDKSQLVGNDTLNYTVSREAGGDVGDYFVTVTVGNNANYVIKPVDGRFTITPASTTGNEDAQIKVNDASSNYGASSPDFSITIGSDLKKPGNLTNADFVFVDKATGKETDGVPTNVGDYQVSLNDSGKAKVSAANPNYDLTDGDFVAGTYVIKPVETALGDQNKQFVISDATAIYGNPTPTFVVTPGKDVVNPGNITNDDFTFINKDTGEVVVGIPSDVGNYEVVLNEGSKDKLTAANPNYVFSDDDFVSGTYTIKPKVTDPKDETTQVTVNPPEITYGDAPSFTISVGSNLTTDGVKLTNDDYMITDAIYTNDGKYLASGSYKVTLNESGLAKLQAVNPNYTISKDSVISTTLVVNKKTITVSANNSGKVFGEADPDLTGTVTGLVGNDNVAYVVNRVEGESAGNYDETVTAEESANYNVKVSGGTFTIKPAGTSTGDADKEIFVNDVTSNFGDKTPNFGVTAGKDVVDPGNLTNDDFIFIDKDTGKTVDGIPTNVGHYEVKLNASGQAKVKNANLNYVFNDGDFISGTYTINDVITHSKITVSQTVHYTGTGVRTPADKTQSIVYDVATSKATGESVYTPESGYATVKTPNINGFTNSGDVAGYTPATTTNKPTDSTVTVTYKPTNNLEYSEITVTRTVHYEGAGKQTPHDVIENVVYKVVTNKTTGEVSYTPQGVYEAVATPDLSGYTNSGDVAESIPEATTNKPEDSLVVVQYKKVSDGNGTNPGNPSNPGEGGNNPGTPSNPGEGGNNSGNGNNNKPGNGGTTPNTPTTPGSGSNSGTGNSGVSTEGIKNSAGSQVKLETLESSNTKGKANKNIAVVKAGILPQTGEQHENVASLIGMAILGGFTALFGLKRRKHEDEE